MLTKAAAIASIKLLLVCDRRRDRVRLVIKSIRKLRQGRYTADVVRSVIKSYVNTIPDDVKECAKMRLRRLAPTPDTACACCLSYEATQSACKVCGRMRVCMGCDAEVVLTCPRCHQ